jgi:hypothetical protein
VHPLDVVLDVCALCREPALHQPVTDAMRHGPIDIDRASLVCVFHARVKQMLQKVASELLRISRRQRRRRAKDLAMGDGSHVLVRSVRRHASIMTSTRKTGSRPLVFVYVSWMT